MIVMITVIIIIKMITATNISVNKLYYCSNEYYCNLT